MVILFEDSYLKVIHKAPGEDSENCGGYPVGRLDRPVEGLLVLAKDGKTASLLDGTIDKTYCAVAGNVPAVLPPEGVWEDLLFHDRRNNKTFVVDRERKGVRKAALRYLVLARDGEEALLKIRLITGRTHQIRVQAASRKMPLNGDGKYGSTVNGDIALCACNIRFAHPVTGEQMDFSVIPEGKNFAKFKEQLNLSE